MGSTFSTQIYLKDCDFKCTFLECSMEINDVFKRNKMQTGFQNRKKL